MDTIFTFFKQVSKERNTMVHLCVTSAPLETCQRKKKQNCEKKKKKKVTKQTILITLHKWYGISHRARWFVFLSHPLSLSLSLSFSVCFYIFPWETAPAKPSVEQWIKVTKKHDVMYTGIKQIEVDNIEKIAGSKKCMFTVDTCTNNTCTKKKREKKRGREGGGGEDIKQIPLRSHVSTLREMPTDEYNGNY